MRDDYDNPWKDIIELYFEHFMSFYFPRSHKLIDQIRRAASLGLQSEVRALRARAC